MKAKTRADIDSMSTAERQVMRQKLTDDYTKAWKAENEAREISNDSIRRLRAAEKRTKEAAMDFAEFDQLRLQLALEESSTVAPTTGKEASEPTG